MKSPITGKEMKFYVEPATVNIKGKEVTYDRLLYWCEDSGETFETTAMATVSMARWNGEDCGYGRVISILEGPTKTTNGHTIKVRAIDIRDKEFDYVFVKNHSFAIESIRVGYDFVMNCNPKFL